jgi:hypothetical protein
VIAPERIKANPASPTTIQEPLRFIASSFQIPTAWRPSSSPSSMQNPCRDSLLQIAPAFKKNDLIGFWPLELSLDSLAPGKLPSSHG